MLDRVKEGVLSMKTHELEKELGISKHTIFYYEKEGIVTPQRDDNGYRSYSQDDLQKLIMVKFLRNLNISIDDVKAILNNELDFKECLKINQIHLEKQIKSLEEVQENIEMYVSKDLPMLPALQQIQRETKNYKLGYQKTTDTVSLGRRLTKKLALKKFLYKFIPTFLIVLFFSVVNDQDILTRILSVLVISFVLTNGLIAADFQFSQLWLRLPLDQTRNQSVEFLNDRIRYYQFKGYMDNVKYFYAVLFGKEDKFMNEYKYEDIQSVELLLKHRYESYGTPIARDWYVLDYRFEFKDGNHFYFYWPFTIDDVKAILNNELDFKECLEINQIHLEKQIKSLEEVQENIEMYVRKDLPMLPALQQIQRESKNYKLGYQKTTDTVSLGRRLTKKLALRKFLYKIPAAITPSFILWICTVALFDENFENPTTLIIIFALLMILFVNIFVATEFQFSQIWLKMPLDQTMNQSVEFLRDGIRYYQFHGYFNNLKYYYGVLFNKAEKYMQFYKYEDIQSVELLLKHRYESYGTPIAKDWYVLDYRFEFKDGNHFYFYWPITLDDDSRFIGTILDEKVENIIDKDHVIDALKNGIHLNDYVKKAEN